MVSVNSAPNIAVRTSDNTTLKVGTVKTEDKLSSTPTISSDKVSSTLKGAAAGAVGVSAIAVTFFAAVGGFKQEGAIVAIPVTIVASIAGGIGGAVGATSTSKLKGALSGAAVGALAGGGFALATSKDFGATAVGAIAGAVIGSAGGFFGSLAAKHK